MKLAFAGFRHGHIMGLYNIARQHPQVQVVAACEEDAETAAKLCAEGKVELTHDRFDEMLANVDCDAVAVGDYFAKRGSLIEASMKAGKHVLADKPICTKLDELARIEKLANERSRVLGCLLDLRDIGAYQTMRTLIFAGEIGEVHTVIFTAQHPLLLGSRPQWYFEDGKHGGTINDIGVHAIDLIPWMTGRTLTKVTAARAWNARLTQHPKFQDAGQFMLELDNHGGVFGDVSYLAPDGIAYKAPQYWRITCHGAGGAIEAALDNREVQLIKSADKEIRRIPASAGTPGGCLEAFMQEIAGATTPGALTSKVVIEASRKSLLIQQAAEAGQFNVSL